jgi:hypothetical protein
MARARIEDPTPGRQPETSTAATWSTQTGGSGKSNIYMVLPQYQFVANGLYQ